MTAADEASLFFRASGRVRSISIEARQPVKKDDVIAEVETGTVGIQLEIARAQPAGRRAAGRPGG